MSTIYVAYRNGMYYEKDEESLCPNPLCDCNGKIIGVFKEVTEAIKAISEEAKDMFLSNVNSRIEEYREDTLKDASFHVTAKGEDFSPFEALITVILKDRKSIEKYEYTVIKEELA